jgi:hypothetical protein
MFCFLLAKIVHSFGVVNQTTRKRRSLPNETLVCPPELKELIERTNTYEYGALIKLTQIV